MQVLPLPAINSSITRVIFHSEDSNIFLVATQQTWAIFVYCPITTRGPEVVQVHTSDAPTNSTPLLLSHGNIASQQDSGHVILQTVLALQEFDPDSTEYDAEAHVKCGSTWHIPTSQPL